MTKLDRIPRLVRTALVSSNDAEVYGDRTIFADQSIDTATPMGRVARPILAGAGPLEGELVRERAQAVRCSGGRGRGLVVQQSFDHRGGHVLRADVEP